MTNLSGANLNNGAAVGPQGEGMDSPSRFPAYPAYKDSGVEWLNQVPDHWCSVPIKYMALERNSLFLDGDWIESKDISSDGIRYITTGNVGEGAYKEQGAGFISEETFHALGCTEVYEGDVLVSRLNNPIGRACVVPDLGGRVVTSVDNVIFRPDSKFDKKFIVYLFSSEEYFKHTSNLARGATMQRISRGLLGNIRVVAPSFEEQTQIARFLDHETARIDALIEEQQRLIELLKEKRQAVISHAVTKGLDPTVPMKDSGVEWLGEVPAHWDVVPTNYRYEIQLGRMLNEQRAQGEHLKPYLRVFDVQWHSINTADLPVMDFPPDAQSMYRLRDGDLLVNEGGSYVGRSAIWRGELDECYYQKALHRLRPHSRKKDISEFFLYVMEMATQQGVFVAGGNQTTIDHLTAEQLRKYRFAFPPLEEQQQIAKFLSVESSKNLSTTAEAEKLIGLLQERRSALISAAVTGKIDVRGWQPPVSTQAPKFEVAEAV